MNGRDSKAEYLRREIEGCKLRRQLIQGNLEDFEMNERMMREFGVEPDDEVGSEAAKYRAEATQDNDQAEAGFRRLLAEHLARTADEQVRPIVARSDEAAIFELLSQVGGLMPTN
jgi:hypothetical protein